MANLKNTTIQGQLEVEQKVEIVGSATINSKAIFHEGNFNSNVFKGDKGATGARGDLGANGSTGFTGDRGPTGSTGPQGYKGSRGGRGPVGFTGSIGPRGYTGSKGSTGPTGSRGDTGPTGFRGSQGPSSSVRGPVGYKGSIGNTGATGYRGSVGFTGGRGPTGDKGSTGSTGPTGYKGSRGSAGGVTSSWGTNSSASLWNVGNVNPGYSHSDVGFSSRRWSVGRIWNTRYANVYSLSSYLKKENIEKITTNSDLISFPYTINNSIKNEILNFIKNINIFKFNLIEEPNIDRIGLIVEEIKDLTKNQELQELLILEEVEENIKNGVVELEENYYIKNENLDMANFVFVKNIYEETKNIKNLILDFLN